MNNLKFYKDEHVGFIGSYFVKQLLNRDFNVKTLVPNNNEATIIDFNVRYVFIDIEFIEVNEFWNGFTLTEIIKYLKTLDLNVIIISFNKDKFVSGYQNIYVNSEYSIENSYVPPNFCFEIPYLINERIINPIDNRKK